MTKNNKVSHEMAIENHEHLKRSRKTHSKSHKNSRKQKFVKFLNAFHNGDIAFLERIEIFFKSQTTHYVSSISHDI